MTHHRRWELPESHLLPDAVVAFVDQELSAGAHERAAAHLAHCASCAADVAAQRAASAAVRQAGVPAISAGFLASLRSIPDHTDLPGSPDTLAVGEDGQVFTVQRPDRVAGLPDSPPGAPLGSSAPLGTSPNVLGNGTRLGFVKRRAAQGAGVVVSGLVLSALALVATSSAGGDAHHAKVGNNPDVAPPFTGVLQARFGTDPHPAPVPATTSTPLSTTPAAPAGTVTTRPLPGPR